MLEGENYIEISTSSDEPGVITIRSSVEGSEVIKAKLVDVRRDEIEIEIDGREENVIIDCTPEYAKVFKRNMC